MGLLCEWKKIRKKKKKKKTKIKKTHNKKKQKKNTPPHPEKIRGGDTKEVMILR